MSEELRQYLAVLIVGTVTAGATLALGALGGLLRPRRAPAGAGTRPAQPARPLHTTTTWHLATATMLVGLGGVLVPVALATDATAGRAALVVVGACVVGVAVGLLLWRRTRHST